MTSQAFDSEMLDEYEEWSDQQGNRYEGLRSDRPNGKAKDA